MKRMQVLRWLWSFWAIVLITGGATGFAQTSSVTFNPADYTEGKPLDDPGEAGWFTLAQADAEGNEVSLHFYGFTVTLREGGAFFGLLPGNAVTLNSAIPIVKVVVTTEEYEQASYLSGKGYSAQGNIGTWTGTAFSVKLTNDHDAITISKIEIFLDGSSFNLSREDFDFGILRPGTKRTLPLTIFTGQVVRLLSAEMPEGFALEESLPLDLAKGNTTLHLTFSPEETGTYEGEFKLVLGDNTVYTLPVSAQCQEALPIASVVNKKLPAQDAFYDFHAEGSKGYGYTVYSRDDWGYSIGQTTLTFPHVSDFADETTFTDGFLDRLDYVEDINRDGYLDFCQYDYYGGDDASVCRMMLSNPDGSYTYIPDAWFLPRLDLNGDGRTDYLSYDVYNDGSWSRPKIRVELTLHLSTPAGTYTETPIALLNKKDYYTSFNPDAWYEKGPYNGESWGVNAMPGVCPEVFTGVSLAKGNTKAKDEGYRLPTRVVDLNGDGRPDLMDETHGYIFYNMSDTRWILGYTGGYTKVVDLNGDGYSDLAVNQDGNLLYYKYIGDGEFQKNTLYENLAVDNRFYVQDLDGDGSQDLLVPISYSNAGSAAYLVPFLNDGDGNLTQQPEFYTDKAYEFDRLQDIDGDGILDMLAWESEAVSPLEIHPYVVFLKGKPGGGFEAGVRILDLLNLNYDPEENGDIEDFGIDRDRMRLNAADIDDDGIMEVWASGVEKGRTHIYKVAGAPALSAPQQPAAPVLSYDGANRSLRVDWSAGQDEHSSACDLTYALRIGTTPGGDDILPANALADGTRRDFGRGNQEEQRSAHFDVGAWVPGTYYVSLQTINNRHMGSAWSEPASFTHSALPGFEVDKAQMTPIDTLTVYFTPLPDAYVSAWDFDGGEVVLEGKGYKKITFPTYGEKTLRLTLTAPDGQEASFRQKTDVLPNYFSYADIAGFGSYRYATSAYLDCNNDGYPDWVGSDGVYLNDGTGRFSKAPGLWNTGLKFSGVAIFDYDRDGYADIVYLGDGISDGYLHNNGNGTFTKKTDAGVSWFCKQAMDAAHFHPLVDFDGDGILDKSYYQYYSDSYFLKRNADGSESQIRPTCVNCEESEVSSGYQSVEFRICEAAQYRVFDFNGDGLPDVYKPKYEGEYPNRDYKGFHIYQNEGGFAFSEHFLPFVSPIAEKDFGSEHYYWVDMNADGFPDIVSYRESDNGKAFYILYNEENLRFSAPVFVSLPVGISSSFSFAFYDIDNNGYVDVLANATDENDNKGAYTAYFGEEGVQKQRFDADGVYQDGGGFSMVDLNADGLMDLGDYTPLLKSVAPNERPSAPNGLKAEMTDKGLLISWEPARDDRTPYASMRYNVSVRRKGQTGAGSYILSPLNGGNATTALQPSIVFTLYYYSVDDGYRYTYDYYRGTSCLIPAEVLTVGEELEISVQAIDLWGMAGAFSPTLTYQVGSHAKISASATACTGTPTEVSYVGTASTATPEWDFDGGVASGSGFGPYSVYWSEAGPKRVSLRVGDEEVYVTVTVNENPSASVMMPEYMLYDEATVIGLPEVSPKATFKWNMAFDGDFVKDGLTGQYVKIEAKPGYRYGSVRFPNHPEIKTRLLKLTVSLDGCSSTYYSPTLHLLGEDDRAEISYVAPDATGHYTVYWKGDNLPDGATGVTVQRESSYSGEFEDLEVKDLDAGSYTDLWSDAAVKSERYRLQLKFGDESGPYSEIHKGVHLSINRGMQDGQYNLIWSAYEGRRLATYRILRGSSEEDLSLLASLSAGNTFYSDLTAGPGDVYYAIEYELYNETYMPLSGGKRRAKAGDRYTGRSNTVGTGNARSIVSAQGLKLLSVTGKDSTSTTDPYLYLYAEIFPASATYRSVNWSLSSGDEALASINQNGRLQANPDNRGGYVTVKATTIDGSNISSTRRIYISTLYTEEPGVDPVPVEGVGVSPSSLNLVVGQAYRLSVTVTPSTATNKTVFWYSSDNGVATVDATGLVQAFSVGEAEITVTTEDGGYQSTCWVIVGEGEIPDDVPVPVMGVSLDQSSVTLSLSQTCRLNATVSPSSATNKAVSWRSSKSSVATVDATGLVRAVSAGVASITVTTEDGGYQATCLVTVTGDTTATSDLTPLRVLVYPNPSSGLFTVETSYPTRASVYTGRGRVLGTYEWPSAGRYEVDLSGRSSGVYILRLSAPQAEKTVKLVVE